MVLVDKDILKRIEDASLQMESFDRDAVTNIGYDLKTKGIYTDEKKELEYFELAPGESVFMASAEVITIPLDCCAKVVLKNSRIRQGLSLESPIYQPGHKTRIFFRITNVSKNVISLYAGKKYATILFDQLTSQPSEPYTGSFADEFDFNGLGAYQGMYSGEIKKLEIKQSDLESLERSIYANVLVILSVFVALFSILTTNVSALAAGTGLKTLVLFDFVLLGCISFLTSLISHILKRKAGAIWYLIVAGLFFLASVIALVFIP